MLGSCQLRNICRPNVLEPRTQVECPRPFAGHAESLRRLMVKPIFSALLGEQQLLRGEHLSLPLPLWQPVSARCITIANICVYVRTSPEHGVKAKVVANCIEILTQATRRSRCCSSLPSAASKLGSLGPPCHTSMTVSLNWRARTELRCTANRRQARNAR